MGFRIYGLGLAAVVSGLDSVWMYRGYNPGTAHPHPPPAEIVLLAPLPPMVWWLLYLLGSKLGFTYCSSVVLWPMFCVLWFSLRFVEGLMFEEGLEPATPTPA